MGSWVRISCLHPKETLLKSSFVKLKTVCQINTKKEFNLDFSKYHDKVCCNTMKNQIVNSSIWKQWVWISSHLNKHIKEDCLVDQRPLEGLMSLHVVVSTLHFFKTSNKHQTGRKNKLNKIKIKIEKYFNRQWIY